ncbi:MAG: CAP domain-containing protein [Candidatus Shapirobacteria bacterium]
MNRFLSLLIIPQERNNHRALLLQPGFFGIFIALYLLNQSFIKSITIARPGILGYSSEITAQKVIDQTNLMRTKSGLPSLRYNPLLAQSAIAKANDMFQNNYWAHNSPSGKNPWSFFKESGYQYSVAGENLAKDFYDTDSMLKAWMKSPTHRANIIHAKYKEIGVGVVNGVLGGVKTTLVVQHFGAPLKASLEEPQIIESLPQEIIIDNIAGAESVIPAMATNPTNPLLISKIIGGIMFFVIIGVLFIDGIITLKNGTQRMTGSSAGHIGFLAIIFLLMLFTRQGAIF